MKQDVFVMVEWGNHSVDSGCARDNSQVARKCISLYTATGIPSLLLYWWIVFRFCHFHICDMRNVFVVVECGDYSVRVSKSPEGAVDDSRCVRECLSWYTVTENNQSIKNICYTSEYFYWIQQYCSNLNTTFSLNWSLSCKNNILFFNMNFNCINM